MQPPEADAAGLVTRKRAMITVARTVRYRNLNGEGERQKPTILVFTVGAHWIQTFAK